jgi:dUTP pyrophosphatase
VIRVQRIGNHALEVPRRHSALAAGMDLQIPTSWIVYPGERTLVPTGWAWEIPDGYVGLIRDRSGLALKGLSVRAGVVDADYRGEVKVLLVNEVNDEIRLEAGDRVAQMIVLPIWKSPVAFGGTIEADELSTTQRQSKGFGSTGV